MKGEPNKITFSEVFQNAYTEAKPRKFSEKIVIFDDLGLVLVWKVGDFYEIKKCTYGILQGR